MKNIRINNALVLNLIFLRFLLLNDEYKLKIYIPGLGDVKYTVRIPIIITILVNKVAPKAAL